MSYIHYKKGGGVRRWLSILMMECFLVGIFAERVVVGETEQRKQQKGYDGQYYDEADECLDEDY